MRARDVLRQQRVEHLLGARLELVERQHVVLGRGLFALDDLERQHADDVGLLRHHLTKRVKTMWTSSTPPSS